MFVIAAAPATDHADRASIHAAGSGCPHFHGIGLQDSLHHQRADSRSRFLGQLHPERFPARDGPRAGQRQPGWFSFAGNDADRTQPGGRGTSAGRPAAEAGPQAGAPEKAKGCHGRTDGCGTGEPVIRPTGKSATPRAIRLSSPAAKNISVFPKPKSDVNPRRPVLTQRGVSRSSRTLRRDAVDAAALLTNSANADGEVVWS